MVLATVTLPEFKQWAKDCAPAARAVLMARAYAEVKRDQVDAYIRPIFDRFGFVYGPIVGDYGSGPKPGDPVESPKHLYLVEDDDKLKAFYAECDAAHRAHGFTGPEGHCPALTAENLLTQAEAALIKLAEPLFGVDQVFGENRKRYLELLIGACLKAEKE